ncbi:GHKL domain-containing protein [Tissierella praeacuta]|uniref:sensor histidine kinase n=1 Tax=Tissierella praeacuta TaxID=43131 RepID=UPI003341C6AB
MNSMVMNFFTNTIDTTLVFYFLVKILHKKDIDLKVCILFLLKLIIFNTLINEIFGLANSLGFLSIFIVSTIVYSYLLSEKFYKALLYSILGTGLMFLIEIITVNIIALIFKITPSTILELNIYRVLAIICAKGGFYLFIKYLIQKIYIPRYMKANNMWSIILSGFFNILVVYMIFVLYKIMEIKSVAGYVFSIGMGIGVIIFSWLIFSTSKRKIYQNQQEIIWKIKEEEFHKKDFYIKSMNDILHTIRSQRHDLNNYLSTLYGLLCLEDYEDAKNYITKINDRVSNMNKIIETNHPVITALVSMKKNKAFEENIDMELEIDMPEDISIDFVDLSIIIGNLLDNAIEACTLMDKDLERKIKLSISVKEKHLILEVTNTKSQKIKLETENITGRFTTKVDQENHGFGLGNIEFIVKQYNGIMNIEDLGQEFKVNIALPIGKDIKYGMQSTIYAI